MWERTYRDFDLLVEGSGEAGYGARVIGSPAGETGLVAIDLPFTDQDIEIFLLRIGRPRRAVRGGALANLMPTIEDFGAKLFDGVFRDQIRVALGTSIEKAEGEGAGLRIRLRLADTPELADLPWEFMYDRSVGRFLALSDWTPLVRYLELPSRIRPFTVTPPLRILLMTANPVDFDTLDAAGEKARLREALAELITANRVIVEEEPTGTLAGLQRQLRRGEYHVFHFIGHGGFDEAQDDGVLFFEGRERHSQAVTGQALGELLHDHRSLRLAVLNACEGARSGREDPFAGTAQSLVRQGIPAVVAMQFEITDDAAITFANSLYEAVGDGYPLDASMAEARKSVKSMPNAVEWATPVLHMRAGDGRVFDLVTTSDEHQPQENELGGLIELRGNDGELPRVADLNPYVLGADPTNYGDRDSYREKDPYVPRTVDTALRAACQLSKRLILVVGPSKAGKTRTAFEAIHAALPDARLLKPDPTHLVDALRHRRVIATDTPLIVWLDDLQRFLVGDHALTLAHLSDLFQRPGHTIVLATLRDDAKKLLEAQPDRAAGTRQLLNDAERTTFWMEPTSDNPVEQRAAAMAYPDLDLSVFGLAEQLTGAPAIRDQYNESKVADPLLRTILEVAIDWERVGITDPIPAEELRTIAQQRLIDAHSHLDLGTDKFAAAIELALTPPYDADQRTPGKVAALSVAERTATEITAYRAYPYLVAYDDSGDGSRASGRPISAQFWHETVERFRYDPEILVDVGISAYGRGNLATAQEAWAIGADDGYAIAMNNLGVLLANQNPPDLEGARAWYQRAADGGYTVAMVNLGVLLANQNPPDLEGARALYESAAHRGDAVGMVHLGVMLESQEPPDLDGARAWYHEAADAGDAVAMYNLGVMLENEKPPDLDGARAWYHEAADAGDADAMYNLGLLLEGQEPPDLDGARVWYRRAADAGNTDAMVNLGVLLRNQKPPDLNGARTWYQKAADAGQTDAMYNLGVVLEDQDPPDLEGARTWYQKAADGGDTDAMNSLGLLLEDQDPPDLEGARVWYQKAADAGDANAMNNLGWLLAFQIDPPEVEVSRRWLQEAADRGDAEGMSSLGELLLRRVVPPELDGARHWITRASELGSTTARELLTEFFPASANDGD